MALPTYVRRKSRTSMFDELRHRQEQQLQNLGQRLHNEEGFEEELVGALKYEMSAYEIQVFNDVIAGLSRAEMDQFKDDEFAALKKLGERLQRADRRSLVTVRRFDGERFHVQDEDEPAQEGDQTKYLYDSGDDFTPPRVMRDVGALPAQTHTNTDAEPAPTDPSVVLAAPQIITMNKRQDLGDGVPKYSEDIVTMSGIFPKVPMGWHPVWQSPDGSVSVSGSGLIKVEEHPNKGFGRRITTMDSSSTGEGTGTTSVYVPQTETAEGAVKDSVAGQGGDHQGQSAAQQRNLDLIWQKFVKNVFKKDKAKREQSTTTSTYVTPAPPATPANDKPTPPTAPPPPEPEVDPEAQAAKTTTTAAEGHDEEGSASGEGAGKRRKNDPYHFNL